VSATTHELDWEQVRLKLDAVAEEISNDLVQLENNQSKELLSDFVSKLFLNMTEQSQKKMRSQRQTKIMADAKARGTRCGRPCKPLPDNYPFVYRRWKAGEITGAAAARECRMSLSTFRYRAKAYGKDHPEKEHTQL